MDRLIAFVILVAVCILAGLSLVYLVSNAETDRLNAQAGVERARGEARAMIIESQGQARLDSAIATNLILMSALPVLGLTVLGLLGLSVIVLIAYLSTRATMNRPQRIIEQQVIYLVPKGNSYRMITNGQKPLVIEHSQLVKRGE